MSLDALLTSDPRLVRIRDLVAAPAAHDAAHDLEHLMRVTRTALALADESLDPAEVVAAGLLHDFVNVPKNAPDRAEASERSAREAASLLRELGFDEAAVGRIVEAIRDHSYSRGAIPTHLLGQVLQDADRLDALGAIGILRTASTGERMGARYYDPLDPWARARPLDDKTFSIDHFFAKLLLLPAKMNTERGKAEAWRRARFMEEFLSQLGEEIGVGRQVSGFRELSAGRNIPANAKDR